MTNRNHGFTLIEALVSLTIGSMALALLTTASFQISNSIRNSNKADSGAIAADFMRLERFISGAIPIAAASAFRFTVNQDDSVMLQAPVRTGGIDSAAGCSDAAILTIERTARDGIRLKLDYSFGRRQDNEQFELFRGCDRVQVHCLDPMGALTERWDSAQTPGLPAAIRIEVSYRSGGRQENLGRTIFLRAGRSQ
jgi:prepilin-type N-terminal cleavage/methylation domain-containing protein